MMGPFGGWEIVIILLAMIPLVAITVGIIIGDGGAADNIEWRICRHCGESELWEDVALRESMRIITDVR
jgi:hypothetical protein